MIKIRSGSRFGIGSVLPAITAVFVCAGSRNSQLVTGKVAGKTKGDAISRRGGLAVAAARSDIGKTLPSTMISGQFFAAVMTRAVLFP
jgi:hypothetical protein